MQSYDKSKLYHAYKLLQVSPGDSVLTIKRAYRKLARAFHPDKFSADKAAEAKAEEKMKKINEAYSLIKDAPLSKEKTYDSYVSESYKQKKQTSYYYPPVHDVKIPYAEEWNIQPWIRFLARHFDYAIWLYFIILLNPLILRLQIIPATFSLPTYKNYDHHPHELLLLMLLAIFAWVFLEMLCLAAYGTTPGKWLLGIRIKDKSGNKLNLDRALRRSIKVWFLGMSMGIPGLYLLTNALYLVKILRKGTTSWDSSIEYSITLLNPEDEKIRFYLAAIALVQWFMWMLPCANHILTHL